MKFAIDLWHWYHSFVHSHLNKVLWNLVCRLEAWIPALVTLQEVDPITTMPISTALMLGGWTPFNIKNQDKMLILNMSRSATGAVDPDTCKLIGDIQQINIWKYKKLHTKQKSRSLEVKGEGPWLLAPSTSRRKYTSLYQVSTETVFQCMVCARIYLEWLVKCFI